MFWEVCLRTRGCAGEASEPIPRRGRSGQHWAGATDHPRKHLGPTHRMLFQLHRMLFFSLLQRGGICRGAEDPNPHPALQSLGWTSTCSSNQSHCPSRGAERRTGRWEKEALFLSSAASYFASASALCIPRQHGQRLRLLVFLYHFIVITSARRIFSWQSGEVRNRLLLGRAITLLTSSPPAPPPDRPCYFLGSFGASPEKQSSCCSNNN